MASRRVMRQHQCSEHDPTAAWFKSQWPRNIIPVPKTYPLPASYRLSHSDAGSPVIKPLGQSVKQPKLHTEHYDVCTLRMQSLCGQDHFTCP